MKDTSPKYHVKLMPQDFGDNRRNVFETLKQTIPGLGWDYDLFNKKDQQSNPIYVWEYLTSQQLSAIRDKFAAIDIQLDVEAVGAPFLFPADQLDGFRNNWYSTDLISLDENALLDWAESEGITEAYRFTLLPSFTPPITVRVWPDGIVCKKGSIMSGVPGIVSQAEGWKPSQNDWHHVRYAMEKHHFWTASTWNTVPEGYLINDGEILLFEGYKDSHFKFLEDHSPHEGAAYTLQEVFLSLKPDSQ